MTIVQTENRLHGSTKVAFGADGLPAGCEIKGRSGDPSCKKAEVADYIYQISGELKTIARVAHLDMLVYFLDMVRLEANSQRQDAGAMVRLGDRANPVSASLRKPMDEEEPHTNLKLYR